MTTGGSDADARAELVELAAGLRAHLEYLGSSGATGVPRGEVTSAADASSASRVAAPNVRRAPEAPAARHAPSEGRTTPEAPSPLAGVPKVDEPLVEPAERQRRLAVLAETVKGCTRCALAPGRTQTVFARGTGSSRLMFVGEGPGADEDAQGFPFVGKAGQLLDRMIAAMGFSRDEVYVANIVKCRPPNNRKPEPEEMAACIPYLAEQIELVAPEVMVALGATAVQGLFGTGEGIMRIRGRWRLYKGRIPVMPTFHPAYLLRTPAAKREVWDDLQAVLRQMGRVAPSRG